MVLGGNNISSKKKNRNTTARNDVKKHLMLYSNFSTKKTNDEVPKTHATTSFRSYCFYAIL